MTRTPLSEWKEAEDVLHRLEAEYQAELRDLDERFTPRLAAAREKAWRLQQKHEGTETELF